MSEETMPRKYTLCIEVEIRPQDDFQHFQPDSVTARAPQLGVEWVSGNDGAALLDFFNFFLNWSHVKDQEETLRGRTRIVQRALREHQETRP